MGGSYLVKMQTHFHSYPKLEFYLEFRLKNDDENICDILIFSSDFDKDLITDSGYIKVLEAFLLALQAFIYPDEIEIQN